MELASLIEENPTLLRVGLHFEYNNARDRIAKHLQNNRDKRKLFYFYFKIFSKEMKKIFFCFRVVHINYFDNYPNSSLKSGSSVLFYHVLGKLSNKATDKKKILEETSCIVFN